MKGKYFILGVLGGVLACALVLAVAILVWASRPAPELPPAVPSPTGDVTVSIQESYLGGVVTRLAQEQEPMIQTVVVDVQPGGRVDMIMDLQVEVLGQTLALQARLINAVWVEDAYLHFDLQEIEVGGLGIPLDLLPKSMRNTLETMAADANGQANRMLAENGLVPLGVTSDDSSITASFRAK